MSEKREITVGSFPSRCPYCDEVVEYRDLQPGVNRVRCEYCQRSYIKVVEPHPDMPSNDLGGK
jgi:prepilin signal peptidase PulO-like enzyme (type II secretory pathway)